MQIVITRPRHQSATLAEAIRRHGCEPVFFPTIRISPVDDPRILDRALRDLVHFDWAIFTSANAVESVWTRLRAANLLFPKHLRVAAVGPKTAASLADHGLAPDFVPDDFVAEAIVPGLGALQGKRVFLPLADLAEDTLVHAVETAGGTAFPVTAYHTVPAEPNPAGLAALRRGVGAVTFTSGSTARNFVTLTQSAGLNPLNMPGDPLMVCIGPKTAAAARQAGLRVDRVAAVHTQEGLVQALIPGDPR